MPYIFPSVQTAALIYTTMMFHHTIYRAMSDVIWMEKESGKGKLAIADKSTSFYDWTNLRTIDTIVDFDTLHSNERQIQLFDAFPQFAIFESCFSVCFSFVRESPLSRLSVGAVAAHIKFVASKSNNRRTLEWSGTCYSNEREWNEMSDEWGEQAVNI